MEGYTLIEYVISISILTIIVGVISNYIVKQNKFSLNDTNHSERFDLAWVLKKRINCLTLPNSCTPGEFVTATDSLGQTLIAATSNGTTYGKWRLRIQCQTADELEVQAAKTQDGTNFWQDPLTGEDLDWTHPKAALLDRIGLCPRLGLENFQMVLGPMCTVTGTASSAKPACITAGGNSITCPCAAADPAPCPTGTVTSHIVDDSFGGTASANQYTYGRQKIRYCRSIN